MQSKVLWLADRTCQSIELQLIFSLCQNYLRIRMPLNLIKLVVDLIGRCPRFRTLARLLNRYNVPTHRKSFIEFKGLCIPATTDLHRPNRHAVIQSLVVNHSGNKVTHSAPQQQQDLRVRLVCVIGRRAFHGFPFDRLLKHVRRMAGPSPGIKSQNDARPLHVNKRYELD